MAERVRKHAEAARPIHMSTYQSAMNECDMKIKQMERILDLDWEEAMTKKYDTYVEKIDEGYYCDNDECTERREKRKGIIKGETPSEAYHCISCEQEEKSKKKFKHETDKQIKMKKQTTITSFYCNKS
jgi:hypothetical protein